MLTKDRKIQRSRFENSFAEVSERIGIGVFDERAKKPIKKPGLGFLIFGVILPFIALWFEVSTHTMASILFDPFPSVWHVLLFSFIPISNLIVYLAVRINLVSLYAITSLMSGFAMGIAILYSLMFATKLPAIGTTFINHSEMAFLVLFHPLLYAPLLSVAPLFTAGHVITLLGARQKAFFDGDQLKHFGHIVILIMVLSIEAPSTLTRIYLSKALSPDFASPRIGQRYNQDAVNWLRTWGSREVMLRACYERSGRATDILGSLYEDQHPVSVDDARSVFYLVTGQSFNEATIPASFRSTLKHNGALQDANGLNANADDEFDIDTDIAGQTVSGVARGLSTSNSTISGKVDADKGIASLDWTCSFDNSTYVPREARAKLHLPPGACVTAATIWLDDKKRVATIQERFQARATYVNSVYNHQKDPLLVSMVDPDTLLVQCYPAVKGQVTKIDLHIVAPLFLEGRNKAKLVLPVFSERNFALKNPTAVKIESATKTSINENYVEFDLNPSINSEITNRVSCKPESITVIVDCSVGMQPYIKEVAEGLRNIPIKDVRLIKVLDGETVLLKNGQFKNLNDALNSLGDTKCNGGQDTSTAIANVFLKNIENDKQPSSILWIHGTQPVCDSIALQNLSYAFNSSPNTGTNKLIFDYQVTPGANKLVQDLDLEVNASRIRPVMSTGHPQADFNDFYSTLVTGNQILDLKYLENAETISDDLNILKAYNSTMSNFALSGYNAPSLYDFSLKYHFVGPATSFVVLPEEQDIEEQSFKERQAEKSGLVGCKKADMPMEQLACKDEICSDYRRVKESASVAAPAAAPIAKMQTNLQEAMGGASGAGKSYSAPSLQNASDYAPAVAEEKANYPARYTRDFESKLRSKESFDKNISHSSAMNFKNPVEQLNSLSMSASRTDGVDVRYGQSNEVKKLKAKNRSHGFLDATTIAILLPLLVLGAIIMAVIYKRRK